MRAVDPRLKTLFNTIIPPDEFSGGAWEGGVECLLTELPGGNTLSCEETEQFLARLERAACSLGAQSFEEAGTDARLHALETLASEPETRRLAEEFIRVARIGFYAGSASGRPEPSGWSVTGYAPAPAIPHLAFSDTSLNPIELGEAVPHYDAIVIGAGAGGSVAAHVLAKAGKSVLLVERSRNFNDGELRSDQLHAKRPQVLLPLTGPSADEPRKIVDPSGERVTFSTDGGREWGLNAFAVGGGTRLWQGMTWRFLPEDFRMASIYGIPEGSSLADWPISYDDLAPHYAAVEKILGVSGDMTKERGRLHPAHPNATMPPLPTGNLTEQYRSAAQRLGWSTTSIPFAINSRIHRERAACISCSACIGRACPVNAKNGTHNTFLTDVGPRMTLVTETRAISIVHDRKGNATAVELASPLQSGDTMRRTLTCAVVVVAAGAVETPRLLQLSRLGNANVGRHLQNHVTASRAGLLGQDVANDIGPGHSIATLDHAHGKSPWGGGIVFDKTALDPYESADLGDCFGSPRWGKEHKDWMRSSARRLVSTMAIGQFIPDSRSAITLDKRLLDHLGSPVARIESVTHPTNHLVQQYLDARCDEWLREIGSLEVHSSTVTVGTNATGEHSAGTCRMGDDPADAAANRNGLVYGTSNVYVCDASAHPTNGSVNPALTTMANAHRIAQFIVRVPAA